MSPRRLPEKQREGPTADWKAFKDYLFSRPPSGEITRVAFKVGPPHRGRLPFRISTDGRWTLLCELSDAFPSFLGSLREWMERSLVLDMDGILHPELVTLDSADGVLWMGLFQANWEDKTRKSPISRLVILRSGDAAPIVFCYCDTLETIGNLYYSLMDCLQRNRVLFESGEFWYDVKRFDRLHPRSTTERMMEQLRSQKIERICRRGRLGKT